MTPDPVVTTMLGGAPGDPDPSRGRSLARPDEPRARLLDIVLGFLAQQPELHAALTKEVDEAWRGAHRNRGEFVQAFAERRAQLLSAAAIAVAAAQPDDADGFRSELTRYLTTMEGVSG